MTAKNKNILIIGGQQSGKTTYRAQLYQRVEHAEGELRLSNSVGNMAELETDVDRIVRGVQPLHTNVDAYHHTSISLTDRSGRQIGLDFADYGGEQIRRIGESNSMQNQWVARARTSDAWLFFLRIDHVRRTKSFMTSRLEGSFGSSSTELADMRQHVEFNAIEALQRLLFVRGASIRTRLVAPRIGILLSCWDELSEDEQGRVPLEILQARAPLFHKFISTNWMRGKFRFWALSSTERRLPEVDPDLEFARLGAENFGFVKDEAGNSSKDLTLPLNWLLHEE